MRLPVKPKAGPKDRTWHPPRPQPKLRQNNGSTR